MQKRQVLVNAIMSVLQVLVTGVAFFILYRFLLGTIGIEQLGIWSVVMATTSVANVANLGLSGSVTKFVAKHLAKGDGELVSGVIQTSAISIGIFIILIMGILYPIAHWVLGLVIPDENLAQALYILPYSLLSLSVTVIASVYQSGLDGYQRVDLRSRIMMASVVLNLVLSFMLVPPFGLMGLVWAHLVQVVTVLVASALFLKRINPSLPIIPTRWNKALFKEMFSYGVNFQVISVSVMLYDPIVKALLTRFGGLAMVGFYEMASRMVLQLRALIVSANQVLVPVIAEMQEKTPEVIHSLYKDNYRLIFYISLPFYAAIIALAPLISEAWIGHYEPHFVIFTVLLAGSWLLNTLSAPAYFSYLGIGVLKWNTAGHLAIAALNVGLGFAGGYFLSGEWVVAGWALSLVVGSFMIVGSYNLKYRIGLRLLLPGESVMLLMASLLGVLTSMVIYFRFFDQLNPLAAGGIMILAFMLAVVVPAWLHPMRERLFGWIKNHVK